MTSPSDSLYREIPLTQGRVALVDEADFAWASQWKWYAKFKPSSHAFYAARNDYRFGKGHGITIQLHRELMGLKKGDRRMVDHWDHNTLDDRRRNLRICTPTQNAQNRVRHSNNRSGFKGVTFHPHTGKWRSSISINGRRKSLGLFHYPEQAYSAYCQAAKEAFGEFARFA